MLALVMIAVMLLASPSWAAITCTGTSFPFNTPSNPETQAYTVPAVTNGITLIGFSIRPATRTITGTPTLGGVTLTHVGDRAVSSNTATDVYQLVDAASGSQTISIEYSAAPLSLVVTAVTCENVDQATPVSDTTTATGTGTTVSVTCSSTTDGLVVDFAGANGGTTLTTGAGQTSIDKDSADGVLAAGASSEPGAATVTMSHTVSSGDWGTVCASLKLAASSIFGLQRRMP